MNIDKQYIEFKLKVLEIKVMRCENEIIAYPDPGEAIKEHYRELQIAHLAHITDLKRVLKLNVL